MKSLNLPLSLLTAALLALPAAGIAESVRLQAIQFPENGDCDFEMAPTSNRVSGRIHGEVDVKRGNAKIKLNAENMQPALALGGDVTTYVLWAATSGSDAENLGAIAVRDNDERFHYTTRLKEFALFVTAEEHPYVEIPSSLVLFQNLPVDSKRAKNVPFTYDRWGVPPVHDSSPVRLSYDDEAELDVMQARKVFALAEQRGAESFAPELMRDARVALGQAENYLAGSRESRAADYASRATTLAAKALDTRSDQLTMQARAAKEAAEQRERQALESRAATAEARSDQLRQELVLTEEEKRNLEQKIAEKEGRIGELENRTEALETRRLEAQARLEAAQVSLQALDMDRRDARQEAERLEAERERLKVLVTDLAEQQQSLEGDRQALLAEKQALEAQNRQLAEQKAAAEAEKARVMAGLHESLSKIAETRSTARGLVVSLPDILFDVDKATLKPEASQTLAKLAGVLILVPELELRVEGHTDSTGSVEHNEWLSEARAQSVAEFLVREGIDASRLETEGFGEHQPIADNDTRSGRQQNRRVEVVIEHAETRDAMASM